MMTFKQVADRLIIHLVSAVLMSLLIGLVFLVMSSIAPVFQQGGSELRDVFRGGLKPIAERIWYGAEGKP